ncbi:efflux RND transporter periplasmic adaptor subunit [Aestuariibacter salexigens]|uniref:efflux RND transporter periplasmic adaptor subunit n=1 Tax=Aestuariibacter salexigens TaxID=226010 RepID=UPI00041F33CA|nr:efflux RND transporter periplasmic adaptor subunit [Aestuariibacter salexigens]
MSAEQSFFARIRQRLIQQPVWVALLVVIALILWLASGSEHNIPSNPRTTSSTAVALAKVQATRMAAQPVSREVTLYGRTEPDRTATLRAEVQGQIQKILVDEGVAVRQGQALFEIDKNDLAKRIESAQALLAQRQIELQGARQLDKQGLQSQSALAAAQANLQMAQAQLTSLQLALENTTVTAPFDGVLEQRFVEVGDLVREGDRIASVVDLDPLVIRAEVTENHVYQVTKGQQAIGRLVSGDMLQGTVRYVSKVSQPGTNTFALEVAVANTDTRYVAGISTELSIPLEQTMAVKITPSVMSLDEQGNLGVKVVRNEQVHFVPIDIVKSDREGVWLAGLGEQADVITLGHGYVRHGDRVEVSLVEAPQSSAAVLEKRQ